MGIQAPRVAASTLWASLALSLAAATVLIAGFFGTAGEVGALCALILAAGLVAPTANRPGAVIPNWWPVLVTGTLMVAVGLAVKLGLTVIGGLLIAIGAILTVVALAFALPKEE